MALERKERVVARHAAAVVRHAQESAPARFDINLDAPRARINRILHQFFRHRRGALHHFARGDLIDEMI